MGLWAEIKQRRITQIVLTYLAGGWMFLAVVDQVVDREVLPPVVYQVALTLYLFGIAAALVIGWYHGEKGEQKAPAIEIAILVVVAVGALGSTWQVVQRATSEAQIRDVLDSQDLRSLAVLYLEDVSQAGAIGPLADGVTEGLISALQAAGGDALTVKSRNASRQVRGQGLSADSVAKLLQVGALVDGTVDQVNDEIRISIRLVEGTTGQPLFRETYRWPADDVAGVGAELAEEVATALRQRLGVEIRLREGQAAAPNAAAWLEVARAESHLTQARRSARNGDVEAVIASFAAAEAELDDAVEMAPEWTEPYTLRAQVEYEQYILAQSAEELIAMMEESVRWADRALEINRASPAALEWRGTAAYRRWLLQAEDDATLERLFAQAKADLERAVTLDRQRASVNSTLSHLYYQTGDWSQAILAARSAYDQDAFLDAADGVLWRLYTASYDLGEYDGAREWCEEGYDRFPRNFRFVMCRLWLMTMPESEPDVGRAWEIREELLPLLVERPEFFDLQSQLLVGGVIGRAGLADSAQAVLGQVQASAEVDPDRELWATEAAMRSVMGDVPGALRMLERFVLSQAGQAPDQHWWWDNIRGEPTFQRLRNVN